MSIILPDWSPGLIRKLSPIILKFFPLYKRKYVWFYTNQPYCQEKSVQKFVFIPTKINEFVTCGQKATWWAPTTSVSWCEQHCDKIYKDSILREWKQIKYCLTLENIAKQHEIAII